jgi:putative hydrolase of the HAD superfamily
MPMIEAVAFDLDDTLLLERDFVRSGFRAVAAHLERRLAARRDWFAELWTGFESGVRERAFDCVLQTAGVAPDSELVAELVRVYREHRPAVRPCDDVPEALRRLKLPAPQVGVITDGVPVVQRHKFDALGLSPRVGHFLCTDVWGLEFRKPHPRAFEEFERLSGAPGERCAYVADNPVKDFAVPRRRGWLTVRIVRPGGLHAAEPSRPGEVDRTSADLRPLGRLLGLEDP